VTKYLPLLTDFVFPSSSEPEPKAFCLGKLYLRWPGDGHLAFFSSADVLAGGMHHPGDSYPHRRMEILPAEKIRYFFD